VDYFCRVQILSTRSPSRATRPTSTRLTTFEGGSRIGRESCPCRWLISGPESRGIGGGFCLLFVPRSIDIRTQGSEKYRPPQNLADLVVARDHICRMPGCSRTASTCDLDHVRPWPAGRSDRRGEPAFPLARHHRRGRWIAGRVRLPGRRIEFDHVFAQDVRFHSGEATIRREDVINREAESYLPRHDQPGSAGVRGGDGPRSGRASAAGRQLSGSPLRERSSA
jgi:hypothetical protein